MGGHADDTGQALQRSVRARFARQGLLGTIGAWLVDVQPGRVVIELPYSERVAEAQGVFHPAVIGAVAESAAACAALTMGSADGDVATLEYKINFVRPARGLLLRAEGTVSASAGGVIVARADVTVLGGSEDALCAALQATATSTA